LSKDSSSRSNPVVKNSLPKNSINQGSLTGTTEEPGGQHHTQTDLLQAITCSSEGLFIFPPNYLFSPKFPAFLFL
jgi:hypothetical protein